MYKRQLLKHEIRVVGGMKVAKKVQVHLDTILEELQTLDESVSYTHLRRKKINGS